jgi:hypothetical protein
VEHFCGAGYLWEDPDSPWLGRQKNRHAAQQMFPIYILSP